MIARQRSTHVVVLPNMLAAISGLSPASAGSATPAMPAIAPAALAMIRRLIRLTPATSTTEYIIVMSREPTYGRVSPEAIVETSSFGTPTGRARIAVAITEEP